MHILAATDASDASLHALDRAALVARATGARLTVLHALGLDPAAESALLPAGLLDAVLGGAARRAEEALAAIVDARPALRACAPALHVEHGPPAAAIPAFLRKHGIDLLVVGAHGAGFLNRLLFGSTAHRLVRDATCPVLVVRRAARHAYRRALVPVDFSPLARDALVQVGAVAPEAERVLLHVHDDPMEGLMRYAGVADAAVLSHHVRTRERAEGRMQALAKEAGLESKRAALLVVDGDPLRTILEHEQRMPCDLVVVGRRAAPAWPGSVANGVLAGARGDVLVAVAIEAEDGIAFNH